MLKKRISEYGFIAVGALILALGLQLFMVPSKLTTGGVSGLATVFYYYFKIPLSVTVFSVNLLLMLFAVRSFSLSALLKNFAGIGFLSLFLSVIEPISFGITDPFLSAVFGGVMSGIGIGLTLLHNGSTGGSDFAAMLLHRFFPRISLSAFVIGIDSAVILGSSAVFQDRNLLLYSLISLYLSGRVMDFVLVRGDFAKSVIIVSRKNSEIAQEIMAVLERGVTGLESYGFYDSKKAMALLCVVKKRQIPHLLEIVKTFDSGAFTVVMDARSVHGLGFDEK